MPPGNLHIHPIEVRRAAPADPATVDEWNLPVREAPAVVRTGRARIEPLTMKEVAELSDAGAQIGDYRAFTLLSGILASDTIRRTDTDETFQIRSVLDFGVDRELLLWKLVD